LLKIILIKSIDWNERILDSYGNCGQVRPRRLPEEAHRVSPMESENPVVEIKIKYYLK
jgi:hypothetical protein